MAEADQMPVPSYTTQQNLSGQVFIVIGAGQGIGRQAAHAIAQAGAKTICVGRGREATERVAQEVAGEAILADVTKRDDCARLFRSVEDRHGALHGIVDIVAMGLPPARLADMTDEAWDVQFDNVLRHALYDVQIGAEIMQKSGGGSITFVGSVAGNLATVAQPAYSIAKAALHHLIRIAACELGPANIRVNGVVPGLTITPRVREILGDDRLARVAACYPLGRAPDATDIASAILFMASPMSRNVTGQTLTVDGGASVRASDPIAPSGVPA